MNISRTNIHTIIEHIVPFDALERDDVASILVWIDGDEGLYRRAKPNVPAKHLVSYFVLVDRVRRSVLLMDHRLSGLWLPTGGHVEPDEDPHETVVRELQEELGTRAALVVSVGATPLFVTVNVTNGQGAHTDVSLWYVCFGDERMWIDPDPREFSGHRWMSFEAVLDMDIDELDPGMHRFIHKLDAALDD